MVDPASEHEGRHDAADERDDSASISSSSSSSSPHDERRVVGAERNPTNAGAPAERNPNAGAAERIYVDSCNSKKQLYLLCLGIMHDDAPIFDMESSPWNKAKKKKEVKPKRVEYTMEVSRRATTILTTTNTMRSLQPANWSTKKCVTWLESHPLQDQADVSFLKNEVMRVRDSIIEQRQQQQQEDEEQGGASGTAWRGPLPFLRLIMCLVEDDIKSSYLRRADVLDRRLLRDARHHSEARPPTAFELISEKWNDPEFSPMAPPSKCHQYFLTATDCAHGTVAMMRKANPRKVQDVLASIRTELMRIITEWERSGQGESGFEAETIDESSPLFGNLSNRPARALESRAGFLNGKPSYLLYFWEVADQHQLLASSLRTFNRDSGASDASSAPSVLGNSTSRRRRRDRDEFEEAPSDDIAADIAALSSTLRFVSEREDARARILARREDARFEREDVPSRPGTPV